MHIPHSTVCCLNRLLPRPTRPKTKLGQSHSLLNMASSIYSIVQCLLLLAVARFERGHAQEGATTAKIARMEFVSCPGCKLNRLPEASRLTYVLCHLGCTGILAMRPCVPDCQCPVSAHSARSSLWDAEPPRQVKRFLKDVIEAGDYPGVTVNL